LKKAGILALQGNVEKHSIALQSLGVDTIYVRTLSELKRINCLILPGGESTTIGKLLVRFSLIETLVRLIREGLPVFGTCAGTILLSRKIEQSDQLTLNLLDISVMRNAYGPQIESFETDVKIPILGKELVRAVFIRAPIITKTGSHVTILAEFENTPVLVREANMLASTFHPELASEFRIHKYFLDMTG
jgi:5'-phosphate synthase pdxT subunit